MGELQWKDVKQHLERHIFEQAGHIYSLLTFPVLCPTVFPAVLRAPFGYLILFVVALASPFKAPLLPGRSSEVCPLRFRELAHVNSFFT